MNAQEYQVLDTFLKQLVQARVPAKDPQAAAMIHDAVEQQADAAYLLVQKALILDHALSQAKIQIADLQAQLQAARSSGNAGFMDSSNSWGNTPPPATAAVPASPATGNSPPSMRPGFLGDGLRSTLGNIATTAAGVAGGALLFEGIGHLFHHNSGSGFLGAPAMAGMPSETTVVNNYYDSGTPLTTTGRDDAGFFDDSAGYVDSDDDSLI